MYVLVNNGIVQEIIPDFNPDFPDMPISGRYEAAFVKKLVRVSDGAEVGLNWIYDGGSGGFSPPAPPETDGENDEENDV